MKESRNEREDGGKNRGYIKAKIKRKKENSKTTKQIDGWRDRYRLKGEVEIKGEKVIYIHEL